jgi:aconitate hydratase
VGADGSCEEIELICRIDTSYELDQFRHGGILPFMMRRLMEIA